MIPVARLVNSAIERGLAGRGANIQTVNARRHKPANSNGAIARTADLSLNFLLSKIAATFTYFDHATNWSPISSMCIRVADVVSSRVWCLRGDEMFMTKWVVRARRSFKSSRVSHFDRPATKVA